MSLINFFLDRFKITTIILTLMLILFRFVIKPKWHYFPLYLFVLLFIVLVVLNELNLFRLTEKNSLIISVLSLALILSTGVLLIIFPTEKIPMPSGAYTIGTRIFELEDSSRYEIYSEEKNDKRRIKYQVWYPSDDLGQSKKEMWISDGTLLTRQFARSIFVPYFMFDQMADVESHSYLNTPVSETLDKYPIVVISHGWKGFRELHTDFAEELASNGFIVVSIDHTYGSQEVSFDDGRIAYLNKEALPSVALPSDFQNASRLLTITYGQDVLAVLDDLERLNNKDENLKNKLNLDSIGVLGHSTGGGGDVYASLKDDRIKALMGLDAWLEPLDSKELLKGLTIPSLFIRSEQWSDRANNVSLKELLSNSKDSTVLQMDGTRHTDFTMSYMLTPLTQYGGLTKKSGGRSTSNIQREIILEFFDYTLRDKENQVNLNSIVDKYEELRFIDISKVINKNGLIP